jgi:putative hemolysin
VLDRAKGFAAAMIDSAMRKRFELMVTEFHRELDAIRRERLVPRKTATKTEAGQ